METTMRCQGARSTMATIEKTDGARMHFPLESRLVPSLWKTELDLAILLLGTSTQQKQTHSMWVFWDEKMHREAKILLSSRQCFSVVINAGMLSRFSRIRLFVTLWTIALQAPRSMGFLTQEHWSGLPCSPPSDLPNPGIEFGIFFVSCIGRQVLYHQLHLRSKMSPKLEKVPVILK